MKLCRSDRTLPEKLKHNETLVWFQQQQRKQQSTASESSEEDETRNQTNTLNDGTDYFAMFDLPRRYDINDKELKQKYLTLMTEYHPDKQQQQQQHDQPSEVSMEGYIMTANDITNAYQVLKEPHTRANHLLELIGHPILEHHSKRDNTITSPTMSSSSSSSVELVGMDFLLQVMEWRERIETLALCSKHTESDSMIPCSCGSHDKQKELADMWTETQAGQQKCEDDLAELWKNSSNDDDDDDDDRWLYNVDDPRLQEARKLTAQLQYWHRLETALREEIEL